MNATVQPISLPQRLFVQGDATALPLADKSVQLTFCSPPYLCARTYGIGAQRDCQEWIDWMLVVVDECCRVTDGLVLVNCAGVTRDWRYRPGPEGLLYEWWKRGGECWRPCYWHRVGIPGSGGKQWLRADVEYVLAFKGAPGKIPWSDNTACGHPPKWAPGGEMSHRVSSGARVNQWGHPIASGGTGGGIDDVTCGPARPSHYRADALGFDGRTVRTRAGKGRIEMQRGVSETNGQPLKTFAEKIALGAKLHTKRDADVQANGEAMREQAYLPPVKANPGTLIKTTVGGGMMGHKLAHENEAPFPVALPEFFIKSFCPLGGIVLDPFSGSGTTVHAAIKNGRRGIGLELRWSQCELGQRRMADVEIQLANPLPMKRRKVVEVPNTPTLFDAA